VIAVIDSSTSNVFFPLRRLIKQKGGIVVIAFTVSNVRMRKIQNHLGDFNPTFASTVKKISMIMSEEQIMKKVGVNCHLEFRVVVQ